MRSLVAISVICMQFCWSFGYPSNQGVGAFAYQDSAGNRYGGTYGLKDDQVYNYRGEGNDVSTFGPNPFFDVQDLDSFFPEYFRNFENLLQEAFAKNAEQQRLALNAAKKAFDLTSNQAGYIPNFDSGFDFRFPGVQNFGFPMQGMPNFGQHPFMQNSAFAGGAVGPGYRRQMVNINPINPQIPNVDVSQLSDRSGASKSGEPNYYGVSSSSFASSSNVNGKETTYRGGETVVNENGKITKYSVHS